MASKIKAAADGSAKKGFFASTWNWIVTSSYDVAVGTGPWVTWSASILRQVGWFVVITGIVTALPLVFEVKREGMLEELERAQISQGLAEGKTPQELAMGGLTAAVEPKVLS
eukprot:gene2993-3265_t